MSGTEELLAFVQKRIKTLTKIRKEMLAAGNHEAAKYSEGALDAYEIMRTKIEGQAQLVSEEDDEDDEDDDDNDDEANVGASGGGC